MHDEMDKVVFLRGLGAGEWDLGVLPAKRVTALARWAQTASNQALAQSAPERRYPALLAFGAERLVEVTDELVDLFGKLLADTNAKARLRLGEYHKSVAEAANDKVLLFAQIARLLLDPGLPDEERLGGPVRGGAQGPPGRRPGRLRADRPSGRQLPRGPAGRPLLPVAPVHAPLLGGAHLLFPSPRRRAAGRHRGAQGAEPDQTAQRAPRTRR